MVWIFIVFILFISLIVLLFVNSRLQKKFLEKDYSKVGYDLPISIEDIDIWEKISIATERYGEDLLRIDVYADTTLYQLKYYIKNQDQMTIATFENTRGEWVEKPPILTDDVFPGEVFKKEEVKKNIKEAYEISLEDGGRDYLISKLSSDVYTFATRTISLYRLDEKVIWDMYYDFATDGSSLRVRKED